MAQQGALAFRFREKAEATSEVMRMSNIMHETDVEDLLSRGYLYDEFKPQLIRQHLSYMTRENMIRILLSPNAGTDKISTLYKVPYKTISELS